MKKIEIYTDGSGNNCLTPGGWGYLIVVDGYVKFENCGHLEAATNNDAELEAAIQGVGFIYDKLQSTGLSPIDFDISLVSDSQIILNWANGSNKVRQAAKKDRVVKLQEMISWLNAKCIWVKGHSGNPFNERCDRLANAGRQKLLPNELKEKKNKTSIGTRSIGVFCASYKGSKFVIDLVRKKVERFDVNVHGERDTLIAMEDKE